MPNWDVAVVGSGLAGAAVARRLAGSGARVLLVEGGRPIGQPAGSHVRNAPALRADPDGYFAAIDAYFDYLDEQAPARRLPGAFTMSVFGGMGVVWTNNCPRAVDGVDRPDVVPGPEWETYYEIAERYLHVQADQFEDSYRQRAVVERLAAFLVDQGRELVRLPLSGTRVDREHIRYIGPADVLDPASASVDVAPGVVEAILTDGSRATAVQIDGATYEADHIVVAAGALDTPALLWRSGLRPRALGRYLSYHPVLIGQIVLDEQLSDPGTAPDPPPRLGIPPTPAKPWFTMLLRDTNPLPVAETDDQVAANRLIEIQAFAPVDPHPENRMGPTPLGRLELDVPLRDDDEARRRAIEREADELCDRLGRYREGCSPQWAPLGTPHLMGSCRMGAADDGSSVTDPQGRVWATDNLYLATNGLIPTRLAVNPTLTTVALAIRTADHIADRAR